MKTIIKALVHTLLALILLLYGSTSSAVAASFNGFLQVSINYSLPNNVIFLEKVPSPFSTANSMSGTGIAQTYLPSTRDNIQNSLILTVGPIDGYSSLPEGTASALSSGSSPTLILQNFNLVVEPIIFDVQYFANLITTISDPKTESATASASFSISKSQVNINKIINGNDTLKPDTAYKFEIKVFLPPAVKNDNGKIEPGTFEIAIDNASVSGSATVLGEAK